MNVGYEHEPWTIQRLWDEPDYSRLKNRFIAHRTAFRKDPNSASDLKAYECDDDEHNYTCLSGLIPESLVGKTSFSGKRAWRKSETFFTNFHDHYTANYVLSATADSLVVSNKSSYDVRQYMAEYDPEFKDKTAAASMSYLHFLVIPTRKVYNIVSLEDTGIIKEMISHFKTFWARADSIDKSITRTRLAVDLRAEDVIAGYKKNSDTAAQRTEEFNGVVQDVIKTADELARKLREQKLHEEDFFLGFHAAPDASVGHLHMHVVLAPSEFRKYSTMTHDWKTIPAQAVLEVIDQEKTPA